MYQPTEAYCIAHDVPSFLVWRDPARCFADNPGAAVEAYKSGDIEDPTFADDDLPEDKANWYRKRAREIHGSDGEIEIDGDAPISEGDDDGCYVQAWVWVDAPDADD